MYRIDKYEINEYKINKYKINNYKYLLLFKKLISIYINSQLL